MSNPTLDTAGYSSTIIQGTIRPGLTTYLANSSFTDPESGQRGQPIADPDEPGEWPPLVVTALPGSGRVLYPHVVVQEFGDDAGPIDTRHDFAQHDFVVKAVIHGITATQMFNLRDTTRGYFLDNREALRDAGFAIEDPSAISGSPATWDSTSKTRTWELTITGTLHTHPNP